MPARNVGQRVYDFASLITKPVAGGAYKFHHVTDPHLMMTPDLLQPIRVELPCGRAGLPGG